MQSIFIKNKYGYMVGVCDPSAANIKKSKNCLQDRSDASF